MTEKKEGELKRGKKGTVTLLTSELPRVSVPLAEYRPAAEPGPQAQPPTPQAGVIAVQSIWDLSLSTSHNHDAIRKGELALARAIQASPALAGRVDLCTTKLGAEEDVATSGYVPIKDWAPLAVNLTGGSPHGKLLTVARENDLRHEAATLEGAQKVAARIHVIQCDGHSADDYKGPLAAYREHQKQKGVHVFPIMLPGAIHEFLLRLSTMHEPLPATEEAIEGLFSNILAAVKLASVSTALLRKAKSLRLEDLPRVS